MTQSESCPAGASASEWEVLLKSAALWPWALPVACAPAPHVHDGDARPPGKIPSQYVTEGGWFGLQKWTMLPPATIADVARWRKDTRLGYCLRLGASDALKDGGPRLLALDCDVDAASLADAILSTVEDWVGEPLPIRVREASPRWALLFAVEDAEPGEGMNKRVVTFGDNSNLEILGTGQQLVCAGRHPSGARYAWPHGFRAVRVTMQDFNNLIDTIVTKHKGEMKRAGSNKPRPNGQTIETDDKLVSFLSVIGETNDGALKIECPWQNEHSDGAGGATSTIYFPEGHNGGNRGFKCLHSHCQNRNIGDLIEWARGKGYSDCEYPTHEESIEDLLLPFYSKKSEVYSATPVSVSIAISAPSFTGFEFKYDTFAGGVKTREKGGEWVPLEDHHYFETQIALEKKKIGKKGPNETLVKNAIHAIARRNKFDSMLDLANSIIPEWDGSERVPFFARDCFGTPATEYTKAWGNYLFTALYGRTTAREEIKADIVPVLEGAQGCRKSTLVKKLALAQKTFTEITFEVKDEELKRRLRGRTVIEIPEMAGVRKRELEYLKAIITAESDTFTPKYIENPETYIRRCVFIMTTNEKNYLNDPTGNRRFAPIKIPGKINIEWFEENKMQLWAEARELFKKHGIMQRELEAVSKDEIEARLYADPIFELLEERWDGEKFRDFEYHPTTANIMKYLLNIPDSQLASAGLNNKVRNAMQRLGAEYKHRRTEYGRSRGWFKK